MASHATDIRHAIEEEIEEDAVILPTSIDDEVGHRENLLTTSLHLAVSGHAYEPIKGDDDDHEKRKDSPPLPPDPHDTEDDDLDGGKRRHRRLLEMWRKENVAIMMSYFCVGFALTFISTPITYYAVDELDASSQLTNTLSSVQQLPWSFKLLYGLLSDCIPIYGKRRKPYFILGYIIYVLANFILAMMGSPSMGYLILLVFLQVAGYMLSDVMADALIVERSKFEIGGAVGSIQASGFILRYLGNILGSTAGTILFNKSQVGWGMSINQVFLLNGAFPLVFVFPFTWHLMDFPVQEEYRSLHSQCLQIWDTVQKRSIWSPMVFIYVYNLLMIPNAAWSNFLIDGLSFSDWMIGVVSIAGGVFAALGITFYRYFLFHDSWRAVYIWTTIILLIFSSLQLLLIFQVNQKWGISNLVFSLGDTSAADFVMAVQFLPMVKMYLQLCPKGSEGTTYAMLTTYGNVAYSCAYSIGTFLVYAFNITNTALEEGDFSGMWKLTLLTSCLTPLSLFFISFIPKSPEHQRELQKSEERSILGGQIFLSVLAFSLAWSVLQTIVMIFVS